MNIRTAVLLTVVLGLCSATAWVAGAAPDDVTGEVLDIREEQGFDQMTILTDRGERMQARLGEAGTCRGMVSSGDQVRIRFCSATPEGGIPLARSMKVRRTGESYMFRNRAGDMNQQWTRTRARDGSCGGVPGAGCPRNPQGPGGGRGAGNGGGRCGGGGARGGGR